MENDLTVSPELPPETKVEIITEILIRGDYCSERCQFLQLDEEYDWCSFFNYTIRYEFLYPYNRKWFNRCFACKEKISSK